MADASTSPVAGLAGVVVMLATEASDRGGLRLRDEYRHIRERLATRGGPAVLRHLAHVSLGDLGAVLDDHDDARILHLSGRLAGAGPRLLEAGDSGARPLETSSFMANFARKHRLECVFLNARHEPAQAERIGRRVEWVVSMGSEVDDADAIAFAGEFYSALADGARVDSAFRIALTKSNFSESSSSDQSPSREPALYRHGEPYPLCGVAANGPVLVDSAARAGLDKTEARDFQEKLFPITEIETEMLVEMIEQLTGIALSVTPAAFIQRRLSPRLEAVGMTRFLDYCDYVVSGTKSANEELTELIESVTTHETYFFREQYQLEALSELILPELVERPHYSHPLRIWSAGCSTGEEAYTFAILLLEHRAIGHGHVQVVGTDISPKVIEAARAATYGDNSFRTIPAGLRRKYFAEVDRRWAVNDRVRKMCQFEVLNLLDTEDFEDLGPQDLISCRNVLMYLSARARRNAINAFFERLTPGGYLLLGHSESLLNVETRFERVQLDKDLVYRKPR